MSKTIFVPLRSWGCKIRRFHEMEMDIPGVPASNTVQSSIPDFLDPVITKFYYSGKRGFPHGMILTLGCSEFVRSLRFL